MKVLVGAFNQEKALVGALSVIVKTGCGTDGALHSTSASYIHTTLQVSLLLTHPATDPNQADPGGVTPVHLAALQGRDKIIRLMGATETVLHVFSSPYLSPELDKLYVMKATFTLQVLFYNSVQFDDLLFSEM